MGTRTSSTLHAIPTHPAIHQGLLLRGLDILLEVALTQVGSTLIPSLRKRAKIRATHGGESVIVTITEELDKKLVFAHAWELFFVLEDEVGRGDYARGPPGETGHACPYGHALSPRR